MMQAAENRPGGDASTTRQFVPVWLQLGRQTGARIRKTRTQRTVRPASVEVPDSFR